MQHARLVERYWNGSWGRLARRDIWLWNLPDDRWRVEIGIGSLDTGDRQHWDIADDSDARALLARCLDTGGDGWRELSAGYGTGRQVGR